MSAFIHNGGSSFSEQLLHDLTVSPARFLDEAINLSGDGEIRSIRINSGTFTGVGILVISGPWRIHDCRVRADDTALVVSAHDCLISGNWLTGDDVAALIINGDDNVITGNFFRKGVFVNGDDNTIVGNTIRMFNGGSNAIIVAGDRNYIAENRFINDGAGTPPAVGLEIQSGATENIIGANDFAQATLPITDIGTGTIYKAVREALWPLPGTAAVAAGLDPRRISEDAFIIDASVIAGTAPTGASLIVDVNLNTVSIYPTSAKPTIVAAAFDSGLTIPDTRLVSGADILTVDVDQIGSGVAGADLAIAVRYINVGLIG